MEIYDENDALIEDLSDVTNENGEIELSYVLPEGYQSITIKLTYKTEETYFASTESKQSVNIKLISLGQSYMNTFITLSPYIVFGVAAVSTYVVLRQRKLKRLRTIWQKDATILDDLLKISHIMIIHKEAGVVIFDKKVAIEEIDSDLIGGFLQAISSFRREIRKDIEIEKGTQGFEMDYYDFKIVITDGEYIRAALILDGQPSESLKERQIAFTKEFENKFGHSLSKFDGEIKKFQAAEKLIEDYFYTSLAYPLQLAKHWEVIDLEPLEKDLVEVAEQIQAEKNFFFVSNLLSYGLAGRSESRNQIVSAIISLKDKEVLEPVKLEE
ncbi:MAG: hypothetical protein BAJALOKI2v1_1040012 [Promethearchaeota archaeon]|nr:MAG: hypothetical protein BAJALOKI2v1_1040012 [Candidatus Lokiarchaeota archaeon]